MTCAAQCDTTFNYYSKQTCDPMNWWAQMDLESSHPSAFYTYPLFFYPPISVYPLLFLHLSSVSKSPSILLFLLLLHIYIFLNPPTSPSFSQSLSSLCSWLFAAATPPPLSHSLSTPLPPHPIFLSPGFPQKGNHCTTQPDRALAALNQPFVSDSRYVLWGRWCRRWWCWQINGSVHGDLVAQIPARRVQRHARTRRVTCTHTQTQE